MRHVLALAFLAGASSLQAQEISLRQPVDCVLGTTCYIQQYPDVNPSPAAQDYTCGSLTYDGHKGTDFALPSHNARTNGVAVLAAAGGTVTAVRNDMPDLGRAGTPPEQIETRECGNGVMIDHPGGWQSQYCHMAKGSIRVATGQVISAGTPIGKIGYSGATEFPHLHFALRRDGQIVDPFSFGAETCDDAGQSLWQTNVAYQATGLISMGVAPEMPSFDAVKQGLASVPLRPQAPLIGWALVYGGQVGDVLTITISGPMGKVVDKNIQLGKFQARYLRAVGREAPETGWPEGQYVAIVSLARQGTVQAFQSQHFAINAR